ncbi:MAG: selenide, water dikinase SelD [Planctomycetia bacterium]|nr:selenide, water dikinase SelD [Planctomycetia bacterium]
MNSDFPRHDVVLWGVGHTNAHVLRNWPTRPLPETRLTCVSNFPEATYSGLLPGVLAGQYPPERMQIDLVRLCAAAGARLVIGNATGIDLAEQRLRFDDRPAIPFDVLSIGIGSQPSFQNVSQVDDSVIPIKPMQTFVARLEQRLQWLASNPKRQRGRALHETFDSESSEASALADASGYIHIAVVGAGAGGVEITLCMVARLRAALGTTPFEVTLINASDRLLAGVTKKTANVVRRELAAGNIRLVLGHSVVSVSLGMISLNNGNEIPADLVVWATGAEGPPVLRQLGLPTDERGFLLTRRTLQTIGHDAIFAVGDSGTQQQGPTPKAGVYAVRQGPVLWDNIGRRLRKEPLRDYRPQAKFLKLLNLGDGRAVGEFHGLTFAGRWAWKWKDHIDRKFMRMFQDYRLMLTSLAETPIAQQPMRCTGCGGKVGGAVLSRVLRRLDIPRHEHVELGLEAPDDAAIIRLPAGTALNATVDFFAAPFDDPFTVGRLASLHAASDCFATGAKPIGALASVTVPVGTPRQQEQLLYELLAGALRELRAMGATLVGGHTIEGPQLTIGFTMLAEQIEPPRTKRQLRVGDCLVLTKPLGTGVLLAAHAQARCRSAWFQSLVQMMLVSNQSAASLCGEFDIRGLTDVSGFGLAGHLLEMLRASNVAAELALSAIPILDGVLDLVTEGIESTLAPANRDAEADMDESESTCRIPRYATLFDPQTCGGLLMGVPAEHVEAVLSRLSSQNAVPAAVIGRVVESVRTEPRLRLTTLTRSPSYGGRFT